ncbi:hypothetical protein BH24CHL8_BH24CHL8_03870 [soil metagenome]
MAEEEMPPDEVVEPSTSSAREGVEEVPAEDIQLEDAGDREPDEADAL